MVVLVPNMTFDGAGRLRIPLVFSTIVALFFIATRAFGAFKQYKEFGLLLSSAIRAFRAFKQYNDYVWLLSSVLATLVCGCCFLYAVRDEDKIPVPICLVCLVLGIIATATCRVSIWVTVPLLEPSHLRWIRFCLMATSILGNVTVLVLLSVLGVPSRVLLILGRANGVLSSVSYICSSVFIIILGWLKADKSKRTLVGISLTALLSTPAVFVILGTCDIYRQDKLSSQSYPIVKSIFWMIQESNATAIASSLPSIRSLILDRHEKKQDDSITLSQSHTTPQSIREDVKQNNVEC